MGFALACFTSGCATYDIPKHGLIADASMTEESMLDGKVMKAELACEGPSTVCEVP
jgi:hypothetical protein